MPDGVLTPKGKHSVHDRLQGAPPDIPMLEVAGKCESHKQASLWAGSLGILLVQESCGAYGPGLVAAAMPLILAEASGSLS